MWIQLLIALTCTHQFSDAWRNHQRTKRRIWIERTGDSINIHNVNPWSRTHQSADDQGMKENLEFQIPTIADHSSSYRPYRLRSERYNPGFQLQRWRKPHFGDIQLPQMTGYNGGYPQLEPILETSRIDWPQDPYVQVPDYHRENSYQKIVSENGIHRIPNYNFDKSKTAPVNIVYDNFPVDFDKFGGHYSKESIGVYPNPSGAIVSATIGKPNKETEKYKNYEYGQYPKPQYTTEPPTTETEVGETETSTPTTEIFTETTSLTTEVSTETTSEETTAFRETTTQTSTPKTKRATKKPKPPHKIKPPRKDKVKPRIGQLNDSDYEVDLNDTILSSGEGLFAAESGESTLQPQTEDLETDDLIQEALKNRFVSSIDQSFRSLVFNPVASHEDKFQRCQTPRNESGQCRYIQHCLLPNIVGSLDQFMGYVCIIQERYIGVCCPDFPVDNLVVKWDGYSNEAQNESLQQPAEGCGLNSKTRIIGGTKTEPKEWPWMAALISMESGKFFCGGSLINSRYVLTAAHCTYSIPRNQILVRLGEYDFRNSSDTPGEDYPVVEIKRHAQYSRKTLRNDIALLKLGLPAKFGEFVGTICLPEPGTPYTGETATVVGWGNIRGGGPLSDVLMAASIPVWNNEECSSAQGRTIPKSSICAGSRTGDQGVCNGDSGGPLMLLDSETKTWKVIGIVSWGRRGCSARFPTVFTRVSEYLKWIEVHAIHKKRL